MISLYHAQRTELESCKLLSEPNLSEQDFQEQSDGEPARLNAEEPTSALDEFKLSDFGEMEQKIVS